MILAIWGWIFVFVANLTLAAEPQLSEITAVPEYTNNPTPSYTFQTTATGTINYSGNCLSSTVEASTTINTIIFNELIDGYYDNCSLTLTTASGSTSAPLFISPFTIDTVLPVIELAGSDTITLPFGKDFIDPGAIANDNIDGDITEDIITNNTFFNNYKLGVYEILYSVSDRAGNAATTSRLLKVVDVTAPVITLIGSSLNLILGNEYHEQGVRVVDDVEGDNVIESLTINGSVATNTLGVYYIVYRAYDSSGNTAYATRTINVILDPEIPRIIGLTNESIPRKTKTWQWQSSLPGTTYRFLVNQEETSNLSGEFIAATSTTQVSGDGMYYLHIQAKGGTGKISEIYTYSALLDNTPPKAELFSLPADTTTSNFINIKVGGEGVYEYKYKLDEEENFGHLANVNDRLQINNLSIGPHYLYVIAVDTAGNWQQQGLASFYGWTIISSSGGGGSSGNNIFFLNETEETAEETLATGSEQTIKEEATTTEQTFFSPAFFRVYRDNDYLLFSWQNPQDPNFAKVLIFRGLEITKDMGIDKLRKKYIIYDGRKQEIKIKASKQKTYYYALVAFNRDESLYSDPLILRLSPHDNKAETKPDFLTKDKPKVLGIEYSDFSGLKNLGNLPSSVVETVSLSEAEQIFSQQKAVILNKKEEAIFKRIIDSIKHNISDLQRHRIAYFVHFGTQTTIRLGAGERAGSFSSYLSAFGDIPNSKQDWQDIIKIANGRWPSRLNAKSEFGAKKRFKKIYLREANMDDPHDNAAVTVMAYGLRPANRNMNTEKAAIVIFKNIFKYNPKNAVDWDAVRAIAYSGATR